MKSRYILLAILSLTIGAIALAFKLGLVTVDGVHAIANSQKERFQSPKEQKTKKAVAPIAPAVSVAKVRTARFTKSAFVTGSLIAREEILVAPEIEGLRILQIKVEEGDRVVKNQVLAVLVRDTLDVQLAQNTASLARAEAAIAQARSQVQEANARLVEAKSQLDRAKPLRRKGHLSGSTFDQRSAAHQAAKAQLAATTNGVTVAEAELAQLKAQRRDIEWRLERTEIRAPADGIISKRTARMGSMASGANTPLFQIIENGEIELEGEVTETELANIKPGQEARVTISGVGEVRGKVRLVSPEISRTTRLGTVRVSLSDTTDLKIGTFARGIITSQTSDGLAIPAASVLYGEREKFVLKVTGNKVHQQTIETGLQTGELLEVINGLNAGDLVVAKAGTFLRDGDQIRPIRPSTTVSEAK